MEAFQKPTVSMFLSWQQLSHMVEVEATYVNG
jgi:hypothetical protein